VSSILPQWTYQGVPEENQGNGLAKVRAKDMMEWEVMKRKRRGKRKGGRGQGGKGFSGQEVDSIPIGTNRLFPNGPNK
jgi:hypothetical protein